MNAQIILAAGYSDPSRGWGGIWGVIAGGIVVYFWWRWDKWRQNRGAGEGDPSPDERDTPLSREIPLVDHVSSHVSRETPAVRHRDETPHWGGRIQRVNGSLRRVYQNAKHIAKTGESASRETPQPPRTPAPARPALPTAGEDFDDIDISLVDGVTDEVWDDGDAIFEETTEPEPAVVTVRETREEYAARRVKAGHERPAIVAGLMEHYGVSRATAYRIHDQVPGVRRSAA